MPVNSLIRSELDDDTVLFDNYAYDNSIIGVSTDGRAVYSFDSMVDELITDSGMTRDEAVEWIEYNTIRSIPYAGEFAPIIVYGIDLGGK